MVLNILKKSLIVERPYFISNAVSPPNPECENSSFRHCHVWL